MAEFQEVAKHWKRMCGVYWIPNSCHGCPLAEHEQAYEACSATDINVGRMEELVMAWAAEHPEPVYPTWAEWLIEQGVFTGYFIIDDPRRGDMDIDVTVTKKVYQRIPAELAQKLGIEPKEGSR